MPEVLGYIYHSSAPVTLVVFVFLLIEDVINLLLHLSVQLLLKSLV